MILRDIVELLESWAPKEIAWDKDNVGLLAGSARSRVRRILVTVDITNEVVDEARRNKVDLIITHHPLIFKPIRTILLEDRVGRLLSEIMKNDIAVYALHTNLDFTQHGVSFSLAERIGLGQVNVLHEHHRIYKKLVVYVPEDHSASLIAAM